MKLITITLLLSCLSTFAKPTSTEETARSLAEKIYPLIKAYVETGDRSDGTELAELKQRIATLKQPKLAPAKELKKRRVGVWQTTRHRYSFTTDGTYKIVPKEAGTTKGSWSIKGDTYTTRTQLDDAEKSMVTTKLEILLLDEDFFVTKVPGEDTVFFQYRVK